MCTRDHFNIHAVQINESDREMCLRAPIFDLHTYYYIYQSVRKVENVYRTQMPGFYVPCCVQCKNQVKTFSPVLFSVKRKLKKIKSKFIDSVYRYKGTTYLYEPTLEMKHKFMTHILMLTIFVLYLSFICFVRGIYNILYVKSRLE